MGEKSIFISSCSRRELARRRPAGKGRGPGLAAAVVLPGTVLGLPLLLLAIAVLAAILLGGI